MEKKNLWRRFWEEFKINWKEEGEKRKPKEPTHWILMLIVFGGPLLICSLLGSPASPTSQADNSPKAPQEALGSIQTELDQERIELPHQDVSRPVGREPSAPPWANEEAYDSDKKTPPDESTDRESEESSIPQGAIGWSEAGQHVGEVVTVCGPAVGASYASESNGAPTFIDVGAPYPDAGRVSIVIWGENRGEFSSPPEAMYPDKTLCVTGEVYVYGNACNIEVQSPSQIEVVG